VLYEATAQQLSQAQQAADAAKGAADAADAAMQARQDAYAAAVMARDAAKAAFDLAQQELHAVEQAAGAASALLVNVSATAMAAGVAMDAAQLSSTEAGWKVAAAQRELQLLRGRLLVAEAKQQSLKLQIQYAQVSVWCTSTSRAAPNAHGGWPSVCTQCSRPAPSHAQCPECPVSAPCVWLLQMNVSSVEAEVAAATKQQAATSDALTAAVGDKLQAEAELGRAMVRWPDERFLGAVSPAAQCAVTVPACHVSLCMASCHPPSSAVP
jgi:hypothetical protein